MKISVKNLNKHFLQGKNTINVLNDVNLEIKSGEIIALLGKSGSGKTTMLSMLAGLDRPDQGSIIVDDQDLTKLSEEALCEYRAKKLGIVFQQFHLIPHLTAFENVLLSFEINGHEDKETAMKWLEMVGLKDRADHYPAMLSGGEQQRVAIARALSFGPPVLLADEPTGNLDVETGKSIIDILFKMVREKKITMILVTHDDELAAKADRIVRLIGGKCHS
ncbi:ABC transporter ATP-binding protein [Bacteriovorax sp. PP10]|uniref:ABC transporter ATP-binding protein n=1 Tax=Bacteriovorax antarcticus TaxID=3088717 RepID=A0ABU5VQC0_9BACT|nr:ABC transporter ATP-binding protein [Bacteriovorax sp. PP10]MEA9355122.1 ABC transporter ATP-binding protein [Bacteriovorax sp. PP10]